jgi:hypothetical protein
VSVLTAAALLLSLASRLSAATWTIAAICVSAGPLLGYVLFRGPGLPDYDDDRGNWAEPLGVLSLVVESALLVLALTVLIAARPSRGTVQLQRPTPDFTRPASGTAGSDRHDQQRGRTVDHPPTARHVCAVRPKPKVSWPAGTNSCYVLPITVDSSPADTGPPLMVLAHRR